MKKARIIFLIVFGIIAFSSNAYSQTFYQTAYKNLRDTVFYPQMEKYAQARQLDSLIGLADKSYNYYYEKNEKDRALFLFNLCLYFPSGNGKSNEVISALEKKQGFLRKNTDTLNVHYGFSWVILANAYSKMYDLSKAKNSFINAVSVLEKAKNTPLLVISKIYRNAGFLHIYIGENKEGYRLSKLAYNAFNNIDTVNLSDAVKWRIRYEIAGTYSALGILMSQNKQYELAFAYNQKKYEVYKTLGIKENMLEAFINMSMDFYNTEQYEKALEYAKKAEKIIVDNNFQKKLQGSYIATMGNVAKPLMELGKYDEARDILFSLSDFIDKELPPDNKQKNALLNDVANTYIKQNMPDSAIFYLDEARKYPPYIENAHLLTEVYSQKDSLQKAVHYSEMNISYNLKSKKMPETGKLPTSENFISYIGGSDAVELHISKIYKLYQQTKSKQMLDETIEYMVLYDSLIMKYRDATLIGADDILLAQKYHNIASFGIKVNYKAYKTYKEEKYLVNFFNFITKSTAFKLNAEVNQVADI